MSWRRLHFNSTLGKLFDPRMCLGLGIFLGGVPITLGSQGIPSVHAAGPFLAQGLGQVSL